ncbi:MAG: helix-turn-helix transcriptional regulator [Coprothermobacterota bacterium]|nr:helix-turn-helix transcriptional regulator [Coprothermobacterota bacterium]
MDEMDDWDFIDALNKAYREADRASLPDREERRVAFTSAFGGYLRRLRLAKGQNLREFCRRNAYDPGNWSKVERDLLPAPSDFVALRHLADALGLADSSPQRATLFDLAALQQGRIPADLLEDEQLKSRLLAFFRLLRGEKPTREILQQILKKLEEA